MLVLPWRGGNPRSHEGYKCALHSSIPCVQIVWLQIDTGGGQPACPKSRRVSSFHRKAKVKLEGVASKVSSPLYFILKGQPRENTHVVKRCEKLLGQIEVHSHVLETHRARNSNCVFYLSTSSHLGISECFSRHLTA